ncbi:MAG: hypothetical protein ACOH2M_22855, partial [Cypionkella sp.]
MSLASFFGKDWTVARQGRLRFVARHPILSEIADQLASFDLGDLAARPASIYVGVHSFTKRVLPSGFKIGIQTEHFYDQTGATLWGLPSRAAILRRAMQYDVLLDLSPLNAPAYAFLPAFQAGDGDLVFFGAMNEHRSEAIARLSQSQPVRVLTYGTHGAALLAEIAAARGVVNLHFGAGIY